MKFYLIRVFSTVALIALFVVSVNAAEKSVRPNSARTSEVSIGPALDVTEFDCVPLGGDPIVLCKVYSSQGGIIFEFANPVSSGYYLLRGCDARVETWSVREDIGDSDKASHYLPRFVIDEDTWGIGVGQIPPYVAVRLTGDIVAFEDIVYAETP